MVLLVEHELLTNEEHSHAHVCYWGVCVCFSIFNLLCSVVSILCILNTIMHALYIELIKRIFSNHRFYGDIINKAEKRAPFY